MFPDVGCVVATCDGATPGRVGLTAALRSGCLDRQFPSLTVTELVACSRNAVLSGKNLLVGFHEIEFDVPALPF